MSDLFFKSPSSLKGKRKCFLVIHINLDSYRMLYLKFAKNILHFSNWHKNRTLYKSSCKGKEELLCRDTELPYSPKLLGLNNN